MTTTGQFRPLACDASLRRTGGFAPISYYYGYFSAGAETV